MRLRFFNSAVIANSKMVYSRLFSFENLILKSLEFYSEDVVNLNTETVHYPGEILSREIA